MNKNVNTSRLLTLTAVALGIGAVWSYLHLQDARGNALRAQEDVEDSRRLVHAIETMRTRPALIGEHQREQAELTRRIEETAKVAGIAPGSLALIEPGPAQRLGDSAYLEKPTQVLITQVTLRQLARFLADLTTADASLHVKSLLLNPAESREAGEENWKADVTLTYLIYAPREAP